MWLVNVGPGDIVGGGLNDDNIVAYQMLVSMFLVGNGNHLRPL